MRLLIVLVLAPVMQAAKSFAPEPGVGSSPAGTALACGYLLPSAFFAGSIFKSIGLPRLTGYLFTGIIVGPKVLGLVSAPMAANLGIFNGVAIALIALNGRRGIGSSLDEAAAEDHRVARRPRGAGNHRS